MVLGNRKRLWLFGSLFTILIGALHVFLIYFTNFFRSISSGHSGSNKDFGPKSDTLIELFFVYVFVCTVFRAVIKRLGMECDKLKMNTTSMFFVGEFFCLTYYYIFYRILFESIPNWPTFFVLEFCHLLFEWVCYPLRASDRLNQFITSPQVVVNGWCDNRIVEAVFFPYGLGLEDWQYFVAVDFGIRCFVIVASGVSFTMIILCVSFFPWVRKQLMDSPLL
jgi:hypothetical protein